METSLGKSSSDPDTGAIGVGIVTAKFPRGAGKNLKCNSVQMLHSPLCAGGRGAGGRGAGGRGVGGSGGRGAVVSTDWCIKQTMNKEVGNHRGQPTRQKLENGLE